MLISRELRVLTVGVLLEVRALPIRLADDLGGFLDVLAGLLLGFRDAPGRGAAGTALLHQGERHALVEGTHRERALTVTRAPRDRDALPVDAGCRHLLEGVDDPAQAPGPADERAALGRGVAVQGVDETAGADGLRFLRDHVVRHVDARDAVQRAERRAAAGDQTRHWGRLRPAAGDPHGEGPRFAADL